MIFPGIRHDLGAVDIHAEPRGNVLVNHPAPVHFVSLTTAGQVVVWEPEPRPLMICTPYRGISDLGVS